MIQTEAIEIMAKRRTQDEVAVQFWTDGSVSYCFDRLKVPGAGSPRSQFEMAKNKEAAWLLADEVCFYDVADLPKAVQVARKAVRQKFDDPYRYFRQVMDGKSPVRKGRSIEYVRTKAL